MAISEVDPARVVPPMPTINGLGVAKMGMSCAKTVKRLPKAEKSGLSILKYAC